MDDACRPLVVSGFGNGCHVNVRQVMELSMRLFRNGFTIKRSPVRAIPHAGYWRAAADLDDNSPDLEVGLAGFSIISYMLL